MTGLGALAQAAGLQVDWTDASGQAKRVSDDALVEVLGALGLAADSDAAIADSRERLAAEQSADRAGFVSVDQGAVAELPFAPRGTLHLAGGGTIAVDGVLPAIDETGYHRLELDDGEMTVAVAPSRCFGVADAAPGRRLWGPAVQIPALRDHRTTGFGDFGSLAHSAAAFGQAGAETLAISPIHALFPADPSRFSPYAPSSRLFLNIFYADPGLVGHPLPPEDAPELIDWASAIARRMAALRAAYDAATPAIRDAVTQFALDGGDELRRHARFDALHTHFFGQGARGWQDWPSAYHDPAGDSVADFARTHAAEVDFYLFCQWLADRGLAEAQKAAKDAGMALGLIADLAVGMDGGGSHAWSRRDDLINGLSIGAPPDILGPEGQNWGITGFSPQALRREGFAPFIATVRAALGRDGARAGGIRIDHAMGLCRLWVVPHGKTSKEGAYLSYPLPDMLRILAIESHAARAVVIGEDLGTVPEGFRPASEARGIFGMRVMPFETRGDDLVPPRDYDAQAAAMTGTHDLPTMAGWWQGNDIAWNRRLGRAVADDADATRDRERAGWWRSFQAAGLVEGEAPAADDPDAVVDAALGFVGRTPSAIAILPLEDVVGLVEQPNLPGTTDEHPNWRRRMPDATDALLQRPEVARHVAILNEARTA